MNYIRGEGLDDKHKTKLTWISIGMGVGVGSLGLLYPLIQWLIWKTNDKAASSATIGSVRTYFLGSIASVIIFAILASIAVIGIRWYLTKKWTKYSDIPDASRLYQREDSFQENQPINF